MRFIISILLIFTFIYSKSINDKFIVSVDKNITNLNKHLLELDDYFRDNEYNSLVKKKYKLKFEIEKMGNFNILTIKPIVSTDIKHELLILLSRKYTDIFSIEYKKEEKIDVVDEIIDSVSDDLDMEDIEISQEFDEYIEIENIEENKTVLDEEPIVTPKEKSLLKDIGLEWVGIFFLALFGLISSLYSRGKLIKLEKRQKDLIFDQDKVESEIKNLGVGRDV